MPLPTPNTGETERKFVSRCMGDDTMVSEYPKEGQRTAICYAEWNKKKEVAEVEKQDRRQGEPRDDIERAMAHFNISREEAEEGLRTGKLKLPPRGTAGKGVKEALNELGGWIIDKFRRDTGAVDNSNLIIRSTDGLHQKNWDSTFPDTDTDQADKQATKLEDGVKFRASDYAVVPDEEMPSTWKLRLAEQKSGNFTVAQVSRAITAMQPGGFRGQTVELEPGDKTQAISRISAAISKCDGDDNQKKNLQTRLNRIKELSEHVDTSFWITKSEKAGEEGRLRWYGFPSNKWRDRDVPAQIISEAAHKEFVEYLEKTKDYPVLLSWHTPGTRLGRADWAEYDHGFLIMGGLIDKDKHADAEKLAEKCQREAIGMSHGFVYTYADKEKEVIGKYRTWEVSHLPLSKAANVWTSIDIIRKEVKETMLSEEKKAYLVGLHGQDVVDAIVNKAADLEKDLLSAGIEFKDVVEPEIKEADPEKVAEKAATMIVEGEAFKAIADGIKSLKDEITELKETIIPGLKQEIAEATQKAQKSHDDIIADAMQSKSGAYQASVQNPAPTEKENEQAPGPESEVPYDKDFMSAMTGLPGMAGMPIQTQ